VTVRAAGSAAALTSTRDRAGDVPGRPRPRWRDRLRAHPTFLRWAATFPPTRPIVRRRAAALFDLCGGFVYSQVLLACVRLRLFEMLMDGPQTPDQLALRLSLSVDTSMRLLGAAAALRLAETRRDGRFALGPLGAALVGNPSVAAMVEHHALLYEDLRDPVGLLRGDRSDSALRRFWPYADAAAPAALAPAETAAYSRLMAASQPLLAADVMAACRLGRYRCLLDLGGGDGTFLAAVAAAEPALRLILFDLPAVAECAAARFAAAGMAGRVRAVGGDFRTDPLPEGADIVSLVRVIHDHDDGTALTILRAARQALPPGGTLLVAEPMAATRGAAAVEAYFNGYLLAMGRGRLRRPEALEALMRQAGFSRVRLLPTRLPMLVRVLTGRRGSDADPAGAG
jgi:demethylspheroidene O-methyltransferase